MRTGLACALTLVTAMAAGPALAQSGEITIWSWNIAAEALEMLVPDFNKKYPDVKVSVVNMSHNDVRDRSLAGCAAGGADMPDIVTVENRKLVSGFGLPCPTQ